MYKGGEWLLHKLHDFFHILCVCTYYYRRNKKGITYGELYKYGVEMRLK